MPTIIILLIIGIFVFFAIRKTIKVRKSGGCASCNGCSQINQCDRAKKEEGK